jgi:hypothetical protein
MQLSAVRGMLFEEAILFLLRRAGYQTITSVGTDPTLGTHSAGAGISVKGRGAFHQIDAIADYLVGRPFSHPQRLLVEGKCYTNKKPVDLDTARSAVGVLKDVSEFWATANGLPKDYRRYHYQKAIFSATTFTAPAESYAFAHDIYLVPMAKSSCFRGLLSTIFAIQKADVDTGPWNHDEHPLRGLRLAIRAFLVRDRLADDELLFGGEYGHNWTQFGVEIGRLGGIVVALVGRAFPLFLVPATRNVLQELSDQPQVRFRWASTKGWTITDIRDRILFSFDLPSVLFHMYAQSGNLTRVAAAEMKEDMFAALEAVTFDGATPRVVRFLPDPEWFARLRAFAQRNAEPLIARETS